MRFLCLHGEGTSAAIFKYQTSSFRQKLNDPSITFDFINGPFLSPPAPGIEDAYPGPYYSWWEGSEPSLSSIHAAHKALSKILHDNGPYDGIMTFSQGSALLASFLLYAKQQSSSDASLPFKTAVFICGGIPIPIMQDIGIYVPQKALDIDRASQRNHNAYEEKTNMKKRWETRNRTSGDFQPTFLNDPQDIYGINFTLVPKRSLISIPTVHIYGAMDPRFHTSMQLAYFCEPRLRMMFDHEGGRDVPESESVSERIAYLVRWASDMAAR
ncbi:hypothetical protein PVAG01_08753 [Phlyctema vagabunda]|uniref:Serine hydrolase domain-containing protein n=1 Tax=Phlyctema vagabunda TaxID=108571 RepID=A0ABR4PAF4_9HELO